MEAGNEGVDPATLFELVEILGTGSYGAVYRGLTMDDKREEVAVKIIELEDGDDMEEVQKEIEILAECEHPNVVKYYGSYVKDNTMWIVMEYCGGGSVGDAVLLLGPLKESLIAHITRESLAGLAYLHSIKKIHRDIKGGNILLTLDGQIKLADFGVSAKMNNTFSKRNTFVGTPYWMAPEVILESGYDGKADVWSMGITCLEMAEGDPPNGDVHPMRVLFMIPRDPPPTLQEPQAWSADFGSFLKEALVKDPNSRITAQMCLSHPFLEKTSAKGVAELAQKAKAAFMARLQRQVEEEAASMNDTVDESGTIIHKSRPVATLGQDEESEESDDGSKYDTSVYYSNAKFDENDLAAASPILAAAAANAPKESTVKFKRLTMADTEHSTVKGLYRRDSTIRIPFLSLDVLDATVLVTPDKYNDISGTVASLTSTGLDLDDFEVSATLGNLVRMLEYHSTVQNEIPLASTDAQACEQVVDNLCATLKTIFRV